MIFGRVYFRNIFQYFARFVIVMVIACSPGIACAANWAIVDKLNLAPFVPRVLDAFMTVARGTYEYFVGNGDGIIYILIWTFLAISIFLYAALMWFPKKWTNFLGFSGGGEMWDGKLSGFTMAETVLKTIMRAVIATTFLLQIKPVYITQILVNPFLEFGAIYTHAITDTANTSGTNAPKIECPESVLAGEWLSTRSCEFLVQPVADVSATNNVIIKRGFEFLTRGLHGLISLVPHGGQNIMNVITGLALIFAFVGCNLFMALLIIQGIFDFGMALILYPFGVLAWVAKRNDKWFDIWPPFSEIIKALQKLVTTMIACAFILIINIAVVRALFQSNGVQNVAAGGSATSNFGSVSISAVDFGGHSLLWLSALLTFFLMNAIFDMTRKKLEQYASGMDGLYKQLNSDFKATTAWTKNAYTSIKKAIGLIKK